MLIMASKNKTSQPPLMIKDLTFGQHLARLRKNKGYTQVDLAQKMGVIQVLISDYENDKLRPYHEMVIRFAKALDVTTDELLGFKSSKNNNNGVSLKILRRVKKIEALPPTQQKTILQVLDTFLKGAER